MRRPRPERRPVPAGPRRRGRRARAVRRRAAPACRSASSTSMAELGAHDAPGVLERRPRRRRRPRPRGRAAARRSARLAAERGVTVAFEALAWGRHVNRVGQAWEAVRRADHPAVTLAVDTFHMLARGDDGSALAGIPGDRIGFLQVADAPLLDMNVLEWSRHFRCFPGQGRSTSRAWSPPPWKRATAARSRSRCSATSSARPTRRSPRGTPCAPWSSSRTSSLAGSPARASRWSPPAPPVPGRTDPAFLEVAEPDRLRLGVRRCSARSGSSVAGRHRTKPVTWWRNGDAHVVLNAGRGRCRARARRSATPDRSRPSRPAPRRCCGPRSTAPAGRARRCCPGITSPVGPARLRQRRRRGSRTTGSGDFEP